MLHYHLISISRFLVGDKQPRLRAFRVLLLSLTLMLQSACTYHYSKQIAANGMRVMELADHVTLYRQNYLTIPVKTHLCVAESLSEYEQQLSTNLAEATARTMAYYVTTAELLSAPQTATSALRSAHSKRCDFLLYPQLVYYRDRVSSVAELDQSEDDYIDVGWDNQWLQLTLWDVNSRIAIDRAIIKSRNGIVKFLPHKPNDLTDASLSLYAKHLFSLRSLQAPPLF